MSKFTKGNSKWEYDNTRKHYARGVIRMNGQVIAEIGHSLTLPESESDANGKLIAQAPAMYKALKSALPYLIKAQNDGMNTVVPVSRPIKIIEQLLTAIDGE